MEPQNARKASPNLTGDGEIVSTSPPSLKFTPSLRLPPSTFLEVLSLMNTVNWDTTEHTSLHIPNDVPHCLDVNTLGYVLLQTMPPNRSLALRIRKCSVSCQSLGESVSRKSAPKTEGPVKGMIQCWQIWCNRFFQTTPNKFPLGLLSASP